MFRGPPTILSQHPKTHLLRVRCCFSVVQPRAIWPSRAFPCFCHGREAGVALAALGPAGKISKEGVEVPPGSLHLQLQLSLLLPRRLQGQVLTQGLMASCHCRAQQPLSQ